MNRLIFTAAALLSCTLLSAAPGTNAETWPGLPMLDNRTALHYDRPADFFEEALVIGNGRLGAIVYGGVEEETISLNDITLWTGQPDTAAYNPDSYTYIPQIRALLDEGKYGEANRLNRMIQGHYSENYQPLGTLTLRETSSHPAAASRQNSAMAYHRRLDLSTATANVLYRHAGGGQLRSYFASAPDSVIVVRIQALDAEPAGGGKAGKTNAAEDAAHFSKRIAYHCQLPHEISVEGNQMVIEGYAAYFSKPSYYQRGTQHFWYDSNKGIHFRTVIRVETDGKLSNRFNDELQIDDCTEAVLYISNETSFNGADKDPVLEGREYQQSVLSRIEAAAKKGYDALYASHLSDYQNFFQRVSVDFGKTSADIAAKPTDIQLRDYSEKAERNPDLEALYFQYGRYLLISSSRTPAVPANLQGLWNERLLPPWSSNYTSNINVEENYWPAEPGNMSEMHRSLLQFVQELQRTGEQSAKAYYGVQEGWNLGQNTDIWAMTNPVGLRGGDPSWACWTMGGAWLSTHLWEHYAYGLDLDYLKDVYPTLKGAADFCLNWLIEKDGYLMTSPGTSPEAKYLLPGSTGGLATLYGNTSDLAMTRECLMDALMATKVLEKADPDNHAEYKAYSKRIEETLERLSPYRIGSKGNLQEWYEDWEDADPQHRHQSHLFGLYPGHQITPQSTPSLAKAAARTLEIKGDKTTGWSTGWRVNLQARLRDAEAAYHTYRVLLNYVSPDDYKGPDARRGGGTYPNLLDAHSPFQIDGNFGGCAGVMEMLVQSTLTLDKKSAPVACVDLLPALPSAWAAQGSVSGLCVRGGYEINMAWKKGRLTQLSVRARSQRPASLRLTDGERSWKLSLKAGESRRLL